MKISFLKYIAGMMGVCLAFTLASCGDDDNYSPGKPTAEGAVCAYFNSDNTSDFILEPEDSVIELSVSRKDTTVASAIPLKVVYRDTVAISVPDTVYFDKGVSTQTITIGVKGLEAKKKYNFRIAIDEESADHYSVQDGTTVFNGSVVMSQWTMLKDNMTFYYIDLNKLPDVASEMYQLEGVNKFYITNFMGSGNSMYFTIKGTNVNPNKPSSWNGEIVPIEGMGAAVFDYTTYKLNYVVAGYDDEGYYIYDYSYGGVDINYMDWYGGYGYGAYYSMISYSQNYIYLYGYVSSSVYNGYVGVYGVWN